MCRRAIQFFARHAQADRSGGFVQSLQFAVRRHSLSFSRCARAFARSLTRLTRPRPVPMSIWAMLGAAAARGRRVPRLGWATLTSKIGPVGFYKGRGVKATGKHTRKGNGGGHGGVTVVGGHICQRMERVTLRVTQAESGARLGGRHAFQPGPRSLTLTLNLTDPQNLIALPLPSLSPSTPPRCLPGPARAPPSLHCARPVGV